MSERDFTLTAYMTVIQALKQRQLPVYGISRWIAERPLRGAVIRHDVDRRPMNALRMAEAEAAANVYTTYYFRVVGSAYDKDIMRAVHALGHEVGYHYEDLALCKGDAAAAVVSFKRNLEDLRTAVPVETAAMHGSPLSKHNNLDIWQHASPQDFDLTGEAFITVDYHGTYYFTDTGRSWGAVAANLRDRPPGILQPAVLPRSTRQLCRFISETDIEKIALSAHPERWDDRLAGWLMQGTKDQLVNGIKIAANRLR